MKLRFAIPLLLLAGSASAAKVDYDTIYPPAVPSFTSSESAFQEDILKSLSAPDPRSVHTRTAKVKPPKPHPDPKPVKVAEPGEAVMLLAGMLLAIGYKLKSRIDQSVKIQ